MKSEKTILRYLDFEDFVLLSEIRERRTLL